MAKEKHFRILLGSSICASLFILLISISRWTLVDVVTPFIEPIIELAFWILAIIVMVWSFVYMLTHIIKTRFNAVMPFLIVAITLLISIFAPFTKWITDYDFYSNYEERLAVVKQIQSGQMNVNDANIIPLPKESKHLSKGGGEVMYWSNDNKSFGVLFFTFRGVLDNYSGFAYKSDNNEPSSMDFDSDNIEIRKLREHWYWISSS